MTNVDDVDWSQLTHAYGPATDVPGLLRGVERSDPGTRRKAITDLWGTIWHQGTVYPATAPAVPELARIARDVDLPADDRASLVQLLTAIAHGQSYTNVHGDFMRSVGIAVDDAQIAIELRDVEAAHRAVERVAPDLFRTLAGIDIQIDWRLAQLAAQVPNVSEGALGLLDVLHEATTNVTLTTALNMTRDLVKGRVSDTSLVEAIHKLDPHLREVLDVSTADPRVGAREVVDYLFEQGFDESLVLDGPASASSGIDRR